MAILSMKERFEKRSGKADIMRGREYVRVFVVQTDDISVGPFFVLTARDPTSGTQMPQPGEKHPDDEFALVQDVVPGQIDGSDTIYDVVVSYSTIVANIQRAVAPLDRFPTWSWGFLTTTVPYQFDIDGKPSENTAEVPLDPPLVRTQSIPQLTIRWNTTAFSQSLVTSRMNTINMDAFMVVGYGIPPFQAKLVKWNAEGSSEAGTEFFANSVTLQFKVNDPGWPAVEGEPRPWDTVIAQYGFSQVKIVGNKRIRSPIMVPVPRKATQQPPGPPESEPEEDLVQTQEPLKLDENGRWIDDTDGEPLTHAFNLHRPYQSATFSNLGLPR